MFRYQPAVSWYHDNDDADHYGDDVSNIILVASVIIALALMRMVMVKER